MSALKNLSRDILFLEQGQIPIEQSGLKVEKLDYAGDKEAPENNLKDEDVHKLSNAVEGNVEFQGPLDLSNNDLSDLAALYIQEAIQREGSKNFNKINFGGNPRLSSKSGVFIGQSLIDNVDHPVSKISFKNCDLGEPGVVRIIEASNCNKNIKKINLGLVSDRSLKSIGELLRNNTSLEKLKFSEHKQKVWSTQNKELFIQMLKQNKTLKKVTFIPADKSDPEHMGHYMFKKEIQFYVGKIKKTQKQEEETNERSEECSPEHMFNNLLKVLDDKEEHEKMPLRKFFNNTFGNILNDAVFALMKKQMNSSKTNQIFTMQGSIRFVAQYLQDHLPQHEEMADSEEENEETDEV